MSMSTIQVLDEHIANQIAAGEVVERPASIVKELVENAIDAGSDQIEVAIEEGGLRSISVNDNGSGIAADDCLLAFERHATSKIATGHDLFNIRSLGFRGEALPSIAAVSKLECISASGSDGLGQRIVIEGGQLIRSEQTAASRGTRIRVSDLFYNTPAPLKYMKTIQTELSHISNYIYRLSLAHPDISFTFSHQGKILLQTLGKGELLQVIAAIYGSSIARLMIPAEGESLDYKLHGYIGKPEATRANRFGISIIVNGRYIQNFALSKAVMNAYHTLLPINRFPLAVLNIQMEPSLLDVNVHPSKLEVRFSKEQELLQFIEQTLRQVLQQQVHIPQGRTKKPAATIHEQLQWMPEVASQHEVANQREGDGDNVSGRLQELSQTEGRQGGHDGNASGELQELSQTEGRQDGHDGNVSGELYGEALAGIRQDGHDVNVSGELQGEAQIASEQVERDQRGDNDGDQARGISQVQTRPKEYDHQTSNGGDGDSARGISQTEHQQEGPSHILQDRQFRERADKHSYKTPDKGSGVSPLNHPYERTVRHVPERVKEAWSQFMTASQAAEQLKHSFPLLYPIGQLHGMYIVAQNEDGMYLIDQHAAHERVHYEDFYTKFGSPERYSQALLVPITLEFTPSEAEVIKEQLALFAQTGIEMDVFGRNSFIVRSYPHWFPQGDEKVLIEEMADWVITEGKGIDIAKVREQFAIMCACKAAIKANQNLSMAEIEALLTQLRQCHNPYTCPHGRPIVISYSRDDLAKMFKRIQ